MKITSSELQLQAASAKVVKEKETEILTYWEGDKNKAVKERNTQPGATLELSEKAKNLADKSAELLKAADEEKKDKPSGNNAVYSQKAAATGKTAVEWGELKIKSKEEMTARLLESFIQLVFGKKMKFTQIEDLLQTKYKSNLSFSENFLESLTGDKLSVAASSDGPAATRKVEWNLDYERSYERFESEKMTFNAKGLVKTADGKEIDLQLSLSMSRTLHELSYTRLQANGVGEVEVNLCDPLVINYDGPAADLTNTKYNFDLDADGKEDQISFLKKGSGFLALDKNNDGKINDGNELFGTQSGDGFKDLAKYDQDGNGWIDEGDEIFNKLRIWTKDDKGNDKLLALGQVGIGAIYLGNVDSLMGIVGSDGNQNGQVSKTGIFLKENGIAGTVQHVDLAI